MAALSGTDLLGQPLIVSEARARRDDRRGAGDRDEPARS
jgi:hypothetical protein